MFPARILGFPYSNTNLINDLDEPWGHHKDAEMDEKRYPKIHRVGNLLGNQDCSIRYRLAANATGWLLSSFSASLWHPLPKR